MLNKEEILAQELNLDKLSPLQYSGIMRAMDKLLKEVKTFDGVSLVEGDDEIIIRVYSGISIEDNCGLQQHPVNDVIKAEKLISLNQSLNVYTNSPDFIQAIVFLCENEDIKYELFLNGESTGKDMEPIYEDFNKSFDMINEIFDRKEK